MKNILPVLILIMFSVNLVFANETEERIKKYSGKNAGSLTELYQSSGDDGYVRFILDNSSPNDLAVLTPGYIEKNVELAEKTKEMKYASLYDDTIFRHFVLPLRVSQEPYEEWRERFYNELFPVVKDVSDIEEAAILVNLWAEEQMTYKPTHGKDQAPVTTIRRGYGRCEEMMIIYMAAARSVGIPVRSAGTPLWNFTDSNHAWVEVWTPSGWKYLGEPADRLNKTWFTETTKRASLITSRAFGYYDGEDVIEKKDLSTEISSIRYYTDNWDQCVINVDDKENLPVEGAEVTFYAVSWGGIFPMHTMNTDQYGQVSIPMGKGSVFVGAYHKDKGFGYSMFDTLEGSNDLRIQLNKETVINETDLFFQFQIPAAKGSEDNDEKRYFEGKFDLMKNNASLKRDKRLNGQKETADFAEYFLKSGNFSDNKKFYDKQKDFLKKCDELGGNTENFLKAYKGIDKLSEKEKPSRFKILSGIIQNWDIKELCEIPDSAAIADAVEVFYEGSKRFKKQVPDTIFTQNVITPTWTGSQVVQNGWQKEFYETVKSLGSSNIKTTVKDVIDWTDSRLRVDSAFVYHYYSCPLNPLEIINMKNVPEFYRSKLIDITLTSLGVPTRWRGQLEYFNGKEFVFVEPETESKEDKVNEKTLRLSIYVDGKKVKAEPWNNFLMSELAEGSINYYYYDGENDSLDFVIKYPENQEKTLFVQAGVRNSNGDAAVHLKPLDQTEDSLEIRLTTPREYLDVIAEFGTEALKTIGEYVSDLGIKGSKILMIRGVVPNEPTHRMTDLLIGKASDYKSKGASLVIHTELRDDNDLSDSENFIKKKGNILIPEIADENYPLIFLINENNEVLFAFKGYNMNIADLLLKKIRNN
ncbi:MAG: transglutaminase domain-containing protein [Candidatus Delongbacteria bacterium]|nr:transglutaminase domain-containing protein [Candidatus Delongbacteria bacterium]